jgi:Zn-dependent protease with chaperone function
MWIEGRALWRDGAGLPGRSVTVTLDIRGLTARGLSGEEVCHWPFGTLVVDPWGSAFTLLRKGGDARIEISDPPTRAAFEAAMKALPRQGEPRVSRAFSYTVLVIVALIVVVAAAIWRGIAALAGTLAPMIPGEVVETLDAAGLPAVLEDIGASPEARCTGPAGEAALEFLTGRLAAAGGVRPVDWKAAVYPSAVPNALALPGGTIVITDALLARVGTPDAFAGVLAHEIGHVHHRHGLQKLIHEGGVAVAVAMVTGDATGTAGGAARLLLGAAYSRDAEREADAFAVDTLSAAGGDPRALGPFLMDLERDAGPAGGLWSLVATHPMSEERRQAIEARAADAAAGTGPLIAPADWAAIRGICGTTP